MVKYMAESSKEVLYLIVIGIITAVASTFITDFIKSNFLSNRAIIIGLYFILLVISLMLLIIPTDAFRKRQRLFYQKILIRYSNYIRFIGIIVLIISTTFFVQYTLDYNSSQIIPDLQIKLINNGSEEIHISDRGEFYLTTFRTPGSNQLVTSGKIKLETSDNKYQNEYIIPSKGELIVYAQVIKPAEYLALFQRENVDITVILHRKYGKTFLVIQELPFDRDTFSNYCIPFEIK